MIKKSHYLILKSLHYGQKVPLAVLTIIKTVKLPSPTNILSFPFECPDVVDLPLLGDLVICDEIVRKEAKAQDKTYKEHFAHLIVHGCLHLLGYDHIEAKDAAKMEPLEVKIITKLGYPDPYGDLTNN